MRRVLALSFTLTAVLGGSALAESMVGDPAVGRAFAQDVCSDCHIVDSSQTTAVSHQTRSFPSIAQDAKTTETSLRVFLQSPHIDMPNFILTEAQTDDVVAYILSLRE